MGVTKTEKNKQIQNIIKKNYPWKNTLDKHSGGIQNTKYKLNFAAYYQLQSNLPLS